MINYYCYIKKFIIIYTGVSVYGYMHSIVHFIGNLSHTILKSSEKIVQNGGTAEIEP